MLVMFRKQIIHHFAVSTAKAIKTVIKKKKEEEDSSFHLCCCFISLVSFRWAQPCPEWNSLSQSGPVELRTEQVVCDSRCEPTSKGSRDKNSKRMMRRGKKEKTNTDKEKDK